MFHLFIINPVAGKYDGSKELISEIREIFKDENYEIISTQYKGHAQKISSQYCKEYQNITIYSCGGDGTVNEIVNGMQAYSHANLAIIPIGTGNDFVRSIDGDFKNLSAYLDTTIKKIDLLQVSNYLALNTISVGFDASVAKNVSRFRKFGKQAYNLSVAYSLMSSMKHKYRISIEDKFDIPSENYLLVICANGQFYGGGMHISPYSKTDDGFINFISIKQISRVQVPQFMKHFVTGKYIDTLKKYVHTLECTKISIENNKLIDVSIDGEVIAIRNPEIKILPLALNFVIPKRKE